MKFNKKKVDSYISFNNKNSFINYDIKNEDKLISPKIIKIIKPVERNDQYFRSRNNNSKILSLNNLKQFQLFNISNYSNNNRYRSPLIKEYNQKINLKKYLCNSGRKQIFINSEIDLFRNKINNNLERNNKNKILNSLKNENNLNFNYTIKDNYLHIRNYSNIEINKSNSIYMFNIKSLNKIYNFN